MKKKLFILLCIFYTTGINAQNYAEAMRLGDEALKNKNYKKAIDFYFAAAAFIPNNNGEVRNKVNKVFDAIDTLRNEAEKAKKNAQTNLTKAKNLIDAFYFYDARFALAFKDEKFYFIDKNGDKVDKLSQWDKAEQFDKRGLAKVALNTYEEAGLDDMRYGLWETVIDTTGREYVLYEDLKQINEIDNKKFDSIEAPQAIICNMQLRDSVITNLNQITGLYVYILCLEGWYKVNSAEGSGKYMIKRDDGHHDKPDDNFIKTLKKIMSWKMLTCLELKNFGIDTIPNEIEGLTNLKILSFNNNALKSLPESISKLDKLERLDLRRNKFSETEKDRIKMLLPKCNILFDPY